jgi:glycosyltransferase involved in cell wall biosynthesis
MKIFALAQYYNEEDLAYRNLSWAHKACDKIIVTEGRMTPVPGPLSSSDNTVAEIKRFIKDHDDGKILYSPAHFNPNPSKDFGHWEGYNKTHMIAEAKRQGMEPGDIVFILDCDEFWEPGNFLDACDFFSKQPEKMMIAEEYQFAYNMQTCFDSDHERFFKAGKENSFHSVNHLNADGVVLTKTPPTRWKKKFFHLCWTKDPWLVRAKVVGQRRRSLTIWYNNVYLMWPFNREIAYKNNRCIPPYHGSGFAEGHHTKLYEFDGLLPPCLEDYEGKDYTQYIRDNVERLRI